MTTPVTPQLARLLKEKGFDSLCHSYIGSDGVSHVTYGKNSFSDSRLYTPTIAEVLMWLHDTHEIWIYLIPAEDNKKVFKPFFRGENIISQHLTNFFESPKQAYEAAIEYCLIKLI